VALAEELEWTRNTATEILTAALEAELARLRAKHNRGERFGPPQ
jgi:hypothetical protein